MATKILALTSDGRLTYCSASPEERGKGRCNHIAHIKEGQEISDFLEENSSYSQIIPYRMDDFEKDGLKEVTGRIHLDNPYDYVNGGYINLPSPVWSPANIAEFAELDGKTFNYIRGVLDGKNEIPGYGTGAEALNKYAKDNGYEATTSIFVLPYKYRENIGDIRSSLNTLYNYICVQKNKGDDALQAAYDCLLDNETYKKVHGKTPMSHRGFPIQSLSAKFRGKSGIMREFMTGYTVMENAHMVISNNENLGPDEVSVPSHVACAMFQDEIRKCLVTSGNSYDRTTKWLENMSNPNTIKSKEDLDLLDDCCAAVGAKVLLNRAPSLHNASLVGTYVRISGSKNLGQTQMFGSKIAVDENKNTIGIPPILTSGLNADFDGDTVNIYKINSDTLTTDEFENTFGTKNEMIYHNPKNLDQSLGMPTKDSLIGLLNLL